MMTTTSAGCDDLLPGGIDDFEPLLQFIVAGALPTTVKAGLDLLGFPDRGPAAAAARAG